MKDDCEDVFHLRLQSQGCIFLGGMVPLCTCWRIQLTISARANSQLRQTNASHMHAQTHTRTETQTHAWTDAHIIIKGGRKLAEVAEP